MAAPSSVSSPLSKSVGSAINPGAAGTEHAAGSSAAPKAEEKASLLARSTLSALSRDMSNLGLGLNAAPEQAAAVTENILRLEPTSKPTPTTLAVNLNLTPKQWGIIGSWIENWSIAGHLSYWQLFSLDLLAQLQELQKYMAKDDKHKVTKLLGEDFIIVAFAGLAKISTQGTQGNFPQVELDGLKTGQEGSAFALTSWKECLKNLQQCAQVVRTSRSKGVQKQADEVLKRIELGLTLVAQLSPVQILGKFSAEVASTKTPYRPKAKISTSEVALQELMRLTELYVLGLSYGHNCNAISFKSLLAEKMQEYLVKMAKQKNKIAIAQPLKIMIASELNLQVEKSLFSGLTIMKTLAQVRPGESDAAKTVRGKLVRDLFREFVQYFMLSNFLHVSLRILDQQILAPLYPDKYISIDLCFTRLQLNAHWLFKKLLDDASFPNRPLPTSPVVLSSSEAARLDFLLLSMHQDAAQLWDQDSLRSLLTTTTVIKWNSIRDEKDVFSYESWLTFLKDLQPVIDHLAQLTPQLDKLRHKHMDEIEAFLTTLDKANQGIHIEKWISFFQEVCFTQSLNFCRASMLVQDAHAALELHADFSKIDSEEHLLTEELVSYMELEGLEELLAKAFTPAAPLTPAIDEPKPASGPILVSAVAGKSLGHPLSLESKKAKATPPRATPITPPPPLSLESPSEPEPFKIRRGEKVRKFLKRLKEMGIMPSGRVTGSHHMLKGKEEDQKGVLPIHGMASSLKRGTAHSLQTQINAGRSDHKKA